MFNFTVFVRVILLLSFFLPLNKALAQNTNSSIPFDSVVNYLEQKRNVNLYYKAEWFKNKNFHPSILNLPMDEFINIFRFKRNKRLKFMQNRLLEQEQETYINYRFNKVLVKRITHLEGKDLDTFMARYRPDFEFTKNTP